MSVSSGPVLLGPSARATLRPLTSTRIGGGFWACRQRANREVSIPEGHRQLEIAGTLSNFGLGSYRGKYPFLDSDAYKWLEAAAWELGRAPDEKLRALLDDLVELLGRAQEPDGYLHTYTQGVQPDRRYSQLDWSHELYCAGHLIQAAIADARNGHTRLLAVAIRLADHICSVFAELEAIDGHPEIETALVELFRQTGTSRYLDMARIFVDRRGHGLIGDASFPARYYQDHLPVRAAEVVVGHAVRQLYLNAGVTDLALETGDSELAAVMERQWDEMVATRTYLTGGVGAHHDDESFGDAYELPSERAYCETCAAIASIHWSWRLLLLTGRSRYADLIERTLYNGFASGVSLDGRRFFYVNPLQARTGNVQRQAWYGCACCPPNIMRLVSTVDHYVATWNRTGLQLHQYANGTYGGGPGEVLVRTHYPWEGKVSLEIGQTTGDAWTLSSRVPAWCPRVSTVVNGVLETVLPSDGYLRIDRRWSVGDKVVVDFAMPVRKTMPHPRVDAVRGCLALERGPLVYCLESVDQPAGVSFDDVSVPASASTRVVWNPELLGGVATILLSGLCSSRVESSWWPYSGARSETADSVDLVAVPYFAWANRSPGPMRVWLPTHSKSEET